MVITIGQLPFGDRGWDVTLASETRVTGRPDSLVSVGATRGHPFRLGATAFGSGVWVQDRLRTVTPDVPPVGVRGRPVESPGPTPLSRVTVGAEYGRSVQVLCAARRLGPRSS